MQTFPASLFHWTPAERTFVAEISELSHHPSANGGVDGTFAIRNGKTGGICVFELDHVDHDEAENETTAWVYVSISVEGNKKGLKVVIFND